MHQIKSVSVIIPVNERGEDLISVLKAYISVLSNEDINVEYIVVLAPQYGFHADDVRKLNSDSLQVRVILLNKNYGEAGEIKIGVDHANFDHILTLTPYEQIEPKYIPDVFSQLEDNDVIVVNRWPRFDPSINKIQSLLFTKLMKALSGNVQKDFGCGWRLINKEVFNEIRLYGDFHRFILILTEQVGFKTKEVDLPQSKLDAYRRTYGLKTYLARLLDIVTVGFIYRFIKKPLRFFGAGGVASVTLGIFGLFYLSIEKFFFGVSMGDRPLLLLFSLFLVLGVQLIAIGLIGETVIFTSSKDNKEYRIRKIVN